MADVQKLIAALLVLLWATDPLLAQDAKSLIDIRAEYVWRMIYSKTTGYKSMSIAENGALGIGFAMASETEAETKALASCTERSKFLSLNKPSVPACKTFATGNKWLLPDVQNDPDWQRPTTGKDATMRKGRKYTVNKSKAIILLVHGCNGLGDKLFTDIWGAYFNALGFDLYAPDSFATKHPKDACGQMNNYPAEQISTIWRLRIAQTQRNLTDLRAANPDKPIYLFGHSEGGLIVQMIETKVAGIIVSGEECGVLGAPVAAASTVPLLYIWGEFDQYVNGMGFRITENASKACATQEASHNPKFTVLQGRSHIPWPWNAKVNEAVASFLGNGTITLPKQQTATKKAFANWKRTKKDKRYRNAPPHRASAINKSGTSYMVWGLDNEEDARELALFGCTRATSKKTNVFKTGQHLCSVIDVNGTPAR